MESTRILPMLSKPATGYKLAPNTSAQKLKTAPWQANDLTRRLAKRGVNGDYNRAKAR